MITNPTIRPGAGRVPRKTVPVALFMFVVLLAACSTTQTRESAHAAAVRKMLDRMGTATLLETEAERRFQIISQRQPDRKNYYECLKNEVTRERLLDILVPIYAKHYTEDEAIENYNFLGTEAGMKTRSILYLSVKNRPANMSREEFSRRLGKKFASTFTQEEKIQVESWLRQSKEKNGVISKEMKLALQARGAVFRRKCSNRTGSAGKERPAGNKQ